MEDQVKAIIRELLKYDATIDVLANSDYEDDKEYQFEADEAIQILKEFSNYPD